MAAQQGTLLVFPQAGKSEAKKIAKAMPPRIEVQDATFKMVAKGFGSLEHKFDAGLYLVRVENGGTPFEQVIHLRSGRTADVGYPLQARPIRSSAGVVLGSRGLHE